MPYRTCICISLLHEVILYHLEDQNCLSFYKYADYYKLFLVFEISFTRQIFCFCTVFYNNFQNKGKYFSMWLRYKLYILCILSIHSYSLHLFQLLQQSWVIEFIDAVVTKVKWALWGVINWRSTVFPLISASGAD